jgi:hypothetical protein
VSSCTGKGERYKNAPALLGLLRPYDGRLRLCISGLARPGSMTRMRMLLSGFLWNRIGLFGQELHFKHPGKVSVSFILVGSYKAPGGYYETFKGLIRLLLYS